jgi:thioredoxin-related protein
MKQNTFFTFILFGWVLSGFAHNGAAAIQIQDHWGTDVAAAFDQAQKEDKDVLMLFMGSDWNPACQKLEKEILADPDFRTEIIKRFVVVKLDTLRNSDQKAAVVEQNKKWASAFGVNGFPTLFLLDNGGKPFAIAGFEAASVSEYLGMLEEHRQRRVQRDEKLTEAADKTGLERAKLLDEAMNQMRSDLVELYYPEMVAEIIELDKDDEAGLRTKWNSSAESEIRKAILTDVMTIARLEKPMTAIEFIDEILHEFEFPIQQKMEILNVKLKLLRQAGTEKQVLELFDEMISIEGVTDQTKARLVAKKIYWLVSANRKEDAWKELNQTLTAMPNSPYLLKAKGELHDANRETEAAISAYDAGIKASANSPDLTMELVAAKADSQMDSGQEADALATLDQFIENTANPADLRAQALLHKSMIMRESKRIRQAILAENRAIEILHSTQQRREIQKLVESLRSKYGE